MLHYSFESLKAHSTAVAKILDDAFKVNSYVNSFPHIFFGKFVGPHCVRTQ